MTVIPKIMTSWTAEPAVYPPGPLLCSQIRQYRNPFRKPSRPGELRWISFN